jgi:uncharacterized membrane protein YdbT with pleckstrin-like domain
MGYLQDMLAHEEQIVYRTRQHWLFIAPMLALYVIIAAVIIAGTVIIANSMGNPLIYLLLILLFYPIYRFLEAILRWFNLRYIVTDRRVIELRGTIRKMVSDSSLDKVNDVILTQSVLGRIMNWGDIKILTASETGVNILRRIADPLGFKRAMLDQREGWTRRGMIGGSSLQDALDRLHEAGVLGDQEYVDKSAQLNPKTRKVD